MKKSYSFLLALVVTLLSMVGAAQAQQTYILNGGGVAPGASVDWQSGTAWGVLNDWPGNTGTVVHARIDVPFFGVTVANATPAFPVGDLTITGTSNANLSGTGVLTVNNLVIQAGAGLVIGQGLNMVVNGTVNCGTPWGITLATGATIRFNRTAAGTFASSNPLFSYSYVGNSSARVIFGPGVNGGILPAYIFDRPARYSMAYWGYTGVGGWTPYPFYSIQTLGDMTLQGNLQVSSSATLDVTGTLTVASGYTLTLLSTSANALAGSGYLQGQPGGTVELGQLQPAPLAALGGGMSGGPSIQPAGRPSANGAGGAPFNNGILPGNRFGGAGVGFNGTLRLAATTNGTFTNSTSTYILTSNLTLGPTGILDMSSTRTTTMIVKPGVTLSFTNTASGSILPQTAAWGQNTLTPNASMPAWAIWNNLVQSVYSIKTGGQINSDPGGNVTFAANANGGVLPIHLMQFSTVTSPQIQGKLRLDGNMACNLVTSANIFAPSAVLDLGGQLTINAPKQNASGLSTTAVFRLGMTTPASLTGTGTLQGGSAYTLIELGPDFNGGTIPGARFASPYVGGLILDGISENYLTNLVAPVKTFTLQGNLTLGDGTQQAGYLGLSGNGGVPFGSWWQPSRQFVLGGTGGAGAPLTGQYLPTNPWDGPTILQIAPGATLRLNRQGPGSVGGRSWHPYGVPATVGSSNYKFSYIQGTDKSCVLELGPGFNQDVFPGSDNAFTPTTGTSSLVNPSFNGKLKIVQKSSLPGSVIPGMFRDLVIGPQGALEIGNEFLISSTATSPNQLNGTLNAFQASLGLLMQDPNSLLGPGRIQAMPGNSNMGVGGGSIAPGKVWIGPGMNNGVFPASVFGGQSNPFGGWLSFTNAIVTKVQGDLVLSPVGANGFNYGVVEVSTCVVTIDRNSSITLNCTTTGTIGVARVGSSGAAGSVDDLPYTTIAAAGTLINYGGQWGIGARFAEPGGFQGTDVTSKLIFGVGFNGGVMPTTASVNVLSAAGVVSATATGNDMITILKRPFNGTFQNNGPLQVGASMHIGPQGAWIMNDYVQVTQNNVRIRLDNQGAGTFGGPGSINGYAAAPNNGTNGSKADWFGGGATQLKVPVGTNLGADGGGTFFQLGANFNGGIVPGDRFNAPVTTANLIRYFSGILSMPPTPAKFTGTLNTTWATQCLDGNVYPQTVLNAKLTIGANAQYILNATGSIISALDGAGFFDGENNTARVTLGGLPLVYTNNATPPTTRGFISMNTYATGNGGGDGFPSLATNNSGQLGVINAKHFASPFNGRLDVGIAASSTASAPVALTTGTLTFGSTSMLYLNEVFTAIMGSRLELNMTLPNSLTGDVTNRGRVNATGATVALGSGFNGNVVNGDLFGAPPFLWNPTAVVAGGTAATAWVAQSTTGIFTGRLILPPTPSNYIGQLSLDDPGDGFTAGTEPAVLDLSGPGAVMTLQNGSSLRLPDKVGGVVTSGGVLAGAGNFADVRIPAGFGDANADVIHGKIFANPFNGRISMVGNHRNTYGTTGWPTNGRALIGNLTVGSPNGTTGILDLGMPIGSGFQGDPLNRLSVYAGSTLRLNNTDLFANSMPGTGQITGQNQTAVIILGNNANGGVIPGYKLLGAVAANLFNVAPVAFSPVAPAVTSPGATAANGFRGQLMTVGPMTLLTSFVLGPGNNTTAAGADGGYLNLGGNLFMPASSATAQLAAGLMGGGLNLIVANTAVDALTSGNGSTVVAENENDIVMFYGNAGNTVNANGGVVRGKMFANPFNGTVAMTANNAQPNRSAAAADNDMNQATADTQGNTISSNFATGMLLDGMLKLGPKGMLNIGADLAFHIRSGTSATSLPGHLWIVNSSSGTLVNATNKIQLRGFGTAYNNTTFLLGNGKVTLDQGALNGVIPADKFGLGTPVQNNTIDGTLITSSANYSLLANLTIGDRGALWMGGQSTANTVTVNRGVTLRMLNSGANSFLGGSSVPLNYNGFTNTYAGTIQGLDNTSVIVMEQWGNIQNNYTAAAYTSAGYPSCEYIGTANAGVIPGNAFQDRFKGQLFLIGTGGSVSNSTWTLQGNLRVGDQGGSYVNPVGTTVVNGQLKLAAGTRLHISGSTPVQYGSGTGPSTLSINNPNTGTLSGIIGAGNWGPSYSYTGPAPGFGSGANAQTTYLTFPPAPAAGPQLGLGKISAAVASAGPPSVTGKLYLGWGFNGGVINMNTTATATANAESARLKMGFFDSPNTADSCDNIFDGELITSTATMSVVPTFDNSVTRSLGTVAQGTATIYNGLFGTAWKTSWQKALTISSTGKLLHGSDIMVQSTTLTLSNNSQNSLYGTGVLSGPDLNLAGVGGSTNLFNVIEMTTGHNGGFVDASQFAGNGYATDPFGTQSFLPFPGLLRVSAPLTLVNGSLTIGRTAQENGSFATSGGFDFGASPANLTLGNNNVVIRSGVLTNGSCTRYFITDAFASGFGGKLYIGSMPLQASDANGNAINRPQLFPIGTRNYYAPIIVTNRSTGTREFVGAQVSENAVSVNNGLVANNYSAYVNLSWGLARRSTTGTASFGVAANWPSPNSNLEKGGFSTLSVAPYFTPTNSGVTPTFATAGQGSCGMTSAGAPATLSSAYASTATVNFSWNDGSERELLVVGQPAPTLFCVTGGVKAYSGDRITLNGSNFSPNATVTLGGIAASIVSISGTQIVVTVPSNAVTGSIVVTQGGLTSTCASPNGFTMLGNKPGTPTFTAAPSSLNAGLGVQRLTLTNTGSPSFGTSGVGVTLTTPTGTVFTGTIVGTPTATSIVVDIPAAATAVSGTGILTVNSSTTSPASISMPITPAAIAVTKIDPASTTASLNAFRVAITGKNFVSTSSFDFNGTTLKVFSFATNSDGTATATLDFPASANVNAAVGTVTITNSDGTKGQTIFTVNAAPRPVITNFGPSCALPGGPSFTVTLNGSNFLPGASVWFADTKLTVLTLTATQITATVPSSLLTAAGIPVLRVDNPDKQTIGVRFAITNVCGTSGAALPIVTSANPTGTTATASAFTVVVTGNRFASGAQVYLGGVALTTIGQKDSTQVTAVVPSSLNVAGTYQLTVVNPPFLQSLPLSYTIATAPSGPPAITSVNPPQGFVNKSFDITISGVNFVANVSSVWFNGAQVPVKTYIDGTQIVATLPATPQGDYKLEVRNPSASGPVSAAQTYPIILTNVPVTNSIPVSVFPNPVSDKVMVQASFEKPATVTLKVTNALGQEVMTPITVKTIGGDFAQELNFTELPSGTYFVDVNNGTQRTVKAVVKR